MCGRFTQHLSWSEIVRLLTLNDEKDTGRNTEARYNITPMQTVPFCLLNDAGERAIRDGQWWLVPHWAKEKPKYAMFNARSEDVEKKPSFRDAFKSKRCLIPADGFYEWTKNEEDGGKDPLYIHMPENRPFALSGLSQSSKAPSGRITGIRL